MGEVRQTGRPAAALVGILTLLIIFYIILLPPETREALLEDKNLTATEQEKIEQENVLLSTTIGELTYIQEEKIDHYIPGAYLEEGKESKIFAEYDTFTTSSGLFGSDSKRKLFTIPDIEKTIKVLLTFQAPIRDGKLKIILNNHVIFEDEITTTLPRPIELPEQYLKNNNELLFEATDGFLSSPEYKLEDVKITGTIIDPEKMTAQHTFAVTDQEKENFESSYLEFRASCIQRDVGNLKIKLNGRTISKVTPACDNFNRIEVFSEELFKGRNEIEFLLEEGNARIESAKIRVYLKEPRGFTDFFVIEEEQWKDIQDEKKKVIMDIEFIDDNERKEVEISVNGRRDILYQREPHYTRDITRHAKSGNNYIQLLPLTAVTIVDLEVRVEET